MHPLIRLVRDPQWPSPHSAEVPQGELASWEGRDGWAVDPQQPTTARQLAALADLAVPRGPVAILCPGPSLSRTWPPADAGAYVATIGVNSAARMHQVDWWCGLDDVWQPWAHPRVGICGSVRRFAGGDRALIPRDGLAVVIAEPPEGCPHFTMLVAIGFAMQQLHASRVDVFGCDTLEHVKAAAAGATSLYYADGQPVGNGTPQRWVEEAAGVNVLRKRHGRKLRFIRPADAAEAA